LTRPRSRTRSPSSLFIDGRTIGAIAIFGSTLPQKTEFKIARALARRAPCAEEQASLFHRRRSVPCTRRSSIWRTLTMAEYPAYRRRFADDAPARSALAREEPARHQVDDGVDASVLASTKYDVVITDIITCPSWMG
jgi:hypothetical protein